MKTYAVKIRNGQAVVFDAQTGAQLRTLTSNAVGAQVLGDLIQVTTTDGRTQIYNAATGAMQRQI